MVENHLPHRLLYARTRSGEPFPTDRGRANQARQAAEALFAPKPQIAENTTSRVNPALGEPTPSAAADSRLPTDHRKREAAPVASAPAAASREIPSAHAARIRTWLKYGMTIAEVAAVYGVQMAEIERILR